ncbi:MAG: amino acid adenylation domain-containing protein [Chloroflexi bacterium]|nr:amino acid adenylation domain-containing protein [Chloroflexota bacterium]
MMRLKQGQVNRSPIIPHRTRTERAPLSFAQQRLWFIDQLEPNSPLYNIPAAVRLAGKLDVTALERALNEIARRHESLGTTFPAVNNQPVQVIEAKLGLSLPVVDLRALPNRQAQAMRLAEQDARQSFDLAHGPLVRAQLLRLADDEHILLFAMHHIISDGWSLGVLVRELAALYTAFVFHQSPSLPDLPIQYADFACWQREYLQGDVLEAQLAYWKQQLGSELPVLNLPTDRPRPAVQKNRGAQITFTLPVDLANALVTLSRNEGVTLFMTLFTAFQILLHRYTHQNDICVGTPIANRNRAEIENLIGFFVNTLVLRTNLAGEPNFREVLRRVREVAMGAYAHQDLPFEMLVDVLQPERTLSRTPLFQVMFDLQSSPLAELHLPDLTLNLIMVDPGISKFDLTWQMEASGNSLRGRVEYSTDLFDRATIVRMVGHFQTLLEGISANPDQPIRTLPLLTQAEQYQLLVEWNNTAVDFPPEQCIHQLFETQASKTPDAVAIVYDGAQLTYDELNRRANQLARHLQVLGIGPDVLVGLCVERSPNLIVGALGTLKAGGAYVPMDATYPPERLAFMLQDSRAIVLLTQARVLRNLKPDMIPSSCQVICLDTDWDIIAQESDQAVVSQATSQNLAYVIYTSGSTGVPKGVQLEHQGLVNLVSWTRRTFQVLQTDHATQSAGPGFDASVWEVWSYLAAGASIHILPDELRTSPSQLKDWLVSNSITITFLPTPVAESLLSLDWTTDSALRILHTGGDKLHGYPPSSRPFTLVNNYGPTEDTVVTTSGIVRPVQSEVPPSIGKPIDNTQVYILDDHLQPVPIGVAGELYIGGIGLARGYLNRPELTADKFVNYQLPIAHRPSPIRLYKTGDLARYLPDGNIEFLGRIDFQVKIRGFRVELGEIETQLRLLPTVHDAVVIDRDDPRLRKYLVAYIVPQIESTPQVDELRYILKSKLPSYMVPTTFVLLDALPLTPNGKVDRRALPAPDLTHIRSNETCVTPRTPIEELLAGIWTQVIGVNQVGVYDNFFELGGHSLLATQLVSRVRDAFQIELPLRALFESPTIAGLADVIEQAQRTSSPPIKPMPRIEDQPLSFAQQRLWFLDQLEPNSPLYNISGAIRLKGLLNLAALEQSLNEIVRRHESLRTTIATVDGKPRQVIASSLIVSLPDTDLQGLSISEREAAAFHMATEQARRPFDLAQGPLLRAHLMRLAEDEHIAVFTMHHIISDGWSTGVLLREVAELYQAFSEGKSSPLPALSIQYADFAAWQREWMQGTVLEDQLAYWKQQLAGELSVLNLPTDRPRSKIQTNQGARFNFELGADMAHALNALCRRESVTLFMTLLAAFQTLLYRYCGQEDILVGTPIANRNRAEIEGLIGFFVNTLVLRGNLSGEPSFRELLKRTRETALGAYAHQDLPFEMLVDALQPQRDMSHSALFQVMFVLQNASAQIFNLPGLTWNSLSLDTGTATFDLTLLAEEVQSGLVCSFEYATDLFDEATIARMAGHLHTLLKAIIENPDQSIATLPLLTDAERHQLLIEWNNTQAIYPDTCCVHQLFQAQVERAPDAIAAVFRDEQLSYHALNQRANQLARYLQKCGVTTETLVGICMERSVEMLVGLLGILKAGGAYVPLDPNYPRERLEFMLDDSRAPLLLTQTHLASRFTRQIPCKIICLDVESERISQESNGNVESGVTPENLAFVIYTSGSTGKPKGVEVLHRGVVNHNWAVVQQFRLEPRDRVLQFSTINFDAAAEEIFPTLQSGATLVLRPEGLLTGEELIRLIEKENLTVLDLPTAYWHEWVYELSLSPRPLPASLRLVVVGGEKVMASRLALWQKFAVKDITWMNTYGPTEGTIIATSYTPAFDEPVGEVPIGRPIANTQAYVLDSHLQPTPISVPGELCIGGVGVARGYLNRPELTAEKFISVDSGRWTVNTQPSTRLYKTGDLARYRPDGNLEFMGRADNQVKLRGFRIELGEIETALTQHPAIRQAIVMLREDEPNVKRLVAYVVLTADREQPTPNKSIKVSSIIGDLGEFLKERLPDYMIPSAFVALDALPVMPNGKVDRRALPVPEMTHSESQAADLAPRNRVEEILADIWARVLGVKQVGIHDNFFELGGDSILSIQVVARANQAGLRLTPKQLFQAPTVAGLAAIASTVESIAKHCEQGIVTGAQLLTPIQRWFLEQNFVELHHWNQSVMLTVRETLNHQWLEAAIQQLLVHHDALRLRFTLDEAGWQATYADPDTAIPFEWIDLAGLNETEQQRRIEAQAALCQAMLNLQAGPLVRVTYFHMGAGRDRLLFVSHHLVVDTVSWRILLEDLLTVYEQLAQAQPVQLPPKTTSFQYWSQKLTEYAQSNAVRDELNYWTSMFGDRDIRLPRDYADNAQANTEASARMVAESLCEEETRALLQEIPTAFGAEINDALLTALAQTFSRWAGARSLLVELEGHGREDLFDEVDVSRTVGWFTTVFPVRLEFSSRGLGEALKAIKEQLRTIPKHGIGYGLLRYLKQDETKERLATALQTQVSFNYLGQLDQALPESAPFGLAHEPIGLEHSPRNRRAHLIEISASITSGQLRMEWTYSKRAHRRETIERLASDFIETLRSLIALCRSLETGVYTPSDFGDVQLSQAEIDALIEETSPVTGEKR